MEWLRKQIEEKIKELNKLHFGNSYKQGRVDTLRYVLSLIDQANCDNCIYDISCDKKETWKETDDNMVRIDDITYCSLFKPKENCK